MVRFASMVRFVAVLPMVLPWFRPRRGARTAAFRRLLLVALCVGVLPLAAPSARASLVRWVELEELGAAADLIVTGRVEHAESVERPVAIGVFTDFTVAVDDTVKGGATSSVVVRLPGGTIGQRVTTVDGVPELRVGTRYLLVLHAYDASRFGEEASGTCYTVLGSTQGVWQLDSDASGSITATRELQGGFLDGSGARVLPASRQTLPLTELRARLWEGGR